VGLLFLIATGAGVLSVVLLGPLESLASPQFVAAHARQLTAGALAVLIMAAAIAMIPAMMFPVLKERNEGLALGYVVARSIEVVMLLPAALGPLALVAVTSASAEADVAILPVLIQTYETWGHPVSAVFFCLSVFLLNSLLFASRLVPRLISGWGLVAAVPYLAGVVLVMFDLLTLSSTPHSVMLAPLALNELVLAVWLLVRGFKPAEKSA
jgi:hypothetical protein